MELPYVQPIDPNSATNALMAGVRIAQERRQQAIQNLTEQNRLGLENQKLGLEQQKLTDERAVHARQDQKDKVAEEREQRLARTTAATAVMPYLDPTSPQFNPEMAHMVASMHGVSLATEHQNLQPPPPAPPEPQAPMEGPIQRPQDAAALGRQEAAASMSPQDGPVTPRIQQAGDEAAQEAIRQQQERDVYQAQLADHPRRVAETAEAQKRYQEAKTFPRFTMNFGQGQQPMTIDTGALHHQAEATREARVQLWKQMYAGNQEALDIAVPMARTGVPDKAITDAVNASGALGRKIESAEGIAGANNKTRLEIAAMRKKKGGGGAGGAMSPKQQKLLLAVDAQVQREIEKDAVAKHEIEGLSKYEDASAALKSDNSLGQKLTIDEITKAATGLGARPASVKVFEQATGGVWQQLMAGIEKLQSGKGMSPDQVANVQKFLDYTIADKRKRLLDARARIEGGMRSNPAFAQYGDIVGSAMDTRFGKASAPANPLLTAARNAKIQKMAPADKQAIDWADKHPDDPRAQTILKAHGL